MIKIRFALALILVAPGIALAAMEPPEGYVPGLSPSPPTGLSAYWEGSEIYLEWDENSESDLIGYIVYRSLAKGYGYIKLNTQDGIDNNLNGEIDETDPCELVIGTWYEDESTDLDPDRVYYYRVTAVIEGYYESDWSEAADSGDAEDESLFGCFIATAAYGDPVAPEIQSLRTFRDKFLVNNFPGNLFIKMYYRLSPPIARIIEKHPFLRYVVRKQLAIIVFLCRMFA